MKSQRQVGRQEQGISHEDLAALAKIDRTYVSGIERGARNPTIKVLARFAAAALSTTSARLLTKGAYSRGGCPELEDDGCG